MRALLLVASGLAVAAATAVPSVALTGASEPGPNGHNTFGLCTAYDSGSSRGQAQKQANGVAFVALESAAVAWDAMNDSNESNEPSSETTQQKVAEYCAANGARP
jgi:hypothetical protein